ncbi:MAG: M6 family metalloprotease domain-containing protein [Candidatus Cloacimonetes bacterium]|nr:M6 family metalloprotease domain-containing protein [Candidatus Cloacimonadota bacterium]MCF7868663.1 M6 family metalloprotease domain-containing protein [Candidatus Cloacimonadota bacterium]
MKFKILILLTILAVNLFGAYLTDLPQTLTQPDGTILNCLASGDEFHNWLHDTDNYTIMVHPQTGFYVYAIQNGDEIIPSEFVAGTVDPATVGLRPGANAHPIDFERRTAEFQQILAENRTRVSTIGELNNLVVFIRFADQDEFTETLTQYNNMFNATGQSSLYQYFDEVSDEQLDITSYFYPEPNGNFIVSYQSPNPRSYYLPYNATTNPGGYQPGQQGQREHELLQAAIQFIEPQIPTNLDLDNDDDGKVDNVCFIVKGATGAWADLLWPHMWVLYTLNVYIHGVQVWTYNFQLSASLNSSGVGVLCHEMFHSLGAPDLYHYTGNGISPTGSWDLMCSNTNPPQHMSAWMKYKYGLWFDEVPEINSTGTYSLEPLADSPFSCYKIPSPNSATEFFIVEYRRRTGLFEPSIPGDGLLIYRIDSNENGNAQGPPDEVYLYRPDGTTTVNGSVNQANFSADVGRTMFNDNTNPACFLQYGNPGGIFINDIGYIGDTIEFTLETGIVAMFESNVQSGPASLGVQFQNASFPNNGIELFEWDLDGDGIADSYEENPYFLYENEGTYDVTLTIYMGAETASRTEENFITVTDNNDISGDVSGIWNEVNSPYIISDNIFVNSGDELLIEPGTEIITNNEGQIVVYGKIVAEGTEANKIIFSSDNNWKGIRLSNSQEENIFSNCEFYNSIFSAIQVTINSTALITDNIFTENSSFALGAAIDVNSSDDVQIIRNIISNNTSLSNTGGIGCLSSSPVICNNIIVNNEGGFAGAISLKNGSAPLIENNTIACNGVSNGAIFIFNSSPVIINSIIQNDGELINMAGGNIDITYSCVSGGYTGTGNIDADPLFVDPSSGSGTSCNGLLACWQLNTNSPCIDSGNPDPQYCDPDGTCNDMGAYGGPNSINPTGSDENELISSVEKSLKVYPNPFNPTTTISFSLAQTSSSAIIDIYNLKGQKVKSFNCHPEPVEGYGSNDSYSVIWNGTDKNNRSVASGIYFVRLKSGSVNLSKKVLLLK